MIAALYIVMSVSCSATGSKVIWSISQCVILSLNSQCDFSQSAMEVTLSVKLHVHV